MYHQKPSLGLRLNYAHPLAHGLVAGWVMNEGSGHHIYNITENRITGRLINDVTWQAGGLKFGGFNDRVRLDSMTQYVSYKTNFSIACRTRWGSSVADECIIFFHNGAGLWHQDMIWLAGDVVGPTRDNCVSFTIDTPSGTKNIVHSAANIHWAGVEMSIVGTMEPSVMRLYIDGVEDPNSPDTGPVYTSNVPLSGPPLIGINSDLSDDHEDTIYYIYIYNRTLTAVEAALLHRDPFAMFEPRLPAEFMYSVAVGVAPTGALYGPLVGPLGGPI